ncbi:type II toxin-antitoxin system RelE/ParE family toxin [Avibacterium paragallinarum]|uniref:Addiction module killer protein n=1 Tax=Avibacterium paragallinarum TaxID=728 RepID=A0A377I6D9_AVIPA|nr:type II toxin-antitoxin system RelE/ParE family toxin [Avibacterium paragallinarum]POY45596.1 hypothetical protein C3364_11990 [Avibacterium paragallinarum]RZN57570.1 type II toxin-antitoxin system RelE/ParE family toxin [Avibacterium paragallinarum]RZN57723.1 type II toxin-antitoxin system RelE/ParE family toxin [Avibacterium paragallinarum]RZN76116.1 type II toxin-antitoxin system RelE/ParE family toxin [Avibacterium paragallinarum]TID28690.1 hypothetical protein JO83_02200 [Avibacterium 
MINKIRRSQAFIEWLDKLKDINAKKKIITRINRASFGNFGDHKRLNEILWEMRITEGKGYRVYYTVIGDAVYLLVLGGHKGTQSKDIILATEMAQAVLEELNNERN